MVVLNDFQQHIQRVQRQKYPQMSVMTGTGKVRTTAQRKGANGEFYSQKHKRSSWKGVSGNRDIYQPPRENISPKYCV